MQQHEENRKHGRDTKFTMVVVDIDAMSEEKQTCVYERLEGRLDGIRREVDREIDGVLQNDQKPIVRNLRGPVV